VQFKLLALRLSKRNAYMLASPAPLEVQLGKSRIAANTAKKVHVLRR
jgi:hypothetical protein